MEIKAKKDGKGNIIISEDSFEMLLACLDNQKFINELPQNGDSLDVDKDEYYNIQQDNQNVIDKYNRDCRKILHQKYIFELSKNDLLLSKRYEFQDEKTPWDGEDMQIVYTIFKNTKMVNKTQTMLVKPDGTKELFKEEVLPWLIERPLMYDYDYLTISEDGLNNRPWKKEEVEQIEKLFSEK